MPRTFTRHGAGLIRREVYIDCSMLIDNSHLSDAIQREVLTKFAALQ